MKQKKIMTYVEKFCYKGIPLSIKNTSNMYQRMMNNFFKKNTGDTLKIYMDDKIVNLKKK